MKLLSTISNFFKQTFTSKEVTMLYTIIPFVRLFNIPYVYQGSSNRLVVYLDPVRSDYVDAIKLLKSRINKRHINQHFDTDGIIKSIIITHEKSTFNKIAMAYRLITAYPGFDMMKIYTSLVKYSNDIPFASTEFIRDKNITAIFSPILQHLHVSHIGVNNYMFIREADIDEIYYLLASVPRDMDLNEYAMNLVDSLHSVYVNGYHNPRVLAVLCGVKSDKWKNTVIAAQIIGENYDVNKEMSAGYGWEFSELRAVALLTDLMSSSEDYTIVDKDYDGHKRLEEEHS